MIKFAGLLLVTLTLHSFSIPSANADIIGSQAFDLTFTPSTGSLDQAFSLSNVNSSTNQSGDFASLPTGTAWADFTLGTSFATGSALTISNTDFGTFMGTISSDTGEFGGGTSFFRNLSATGTFTPGTNGTFGGDTNSVVANVAINLNRSSEFAVIGGSLTLDTTAASTVPEPSSFALLMLVTACLAVASGRRRLMGTKASS